MKKCCWVLIVGVLFSCSKKDNNEAPEVNINEEVLSEIYQNEVSVSLSDFKVATLEFTEEVNTISWPISEAELIELRDLWKATKLSWERLEVYDIGPVRSNYNKWQIDYWPANTSLLETKIKSAEGFEQEGFIGGLSASVRGLPSIEYLLFKEQALEELNNDSLRWEYARLLIKDIAVQQGIFEDAWKSYETSFLLNTENGINGSINVLFNNVLNELELMVNNEMGTPLGIKGTNEIVPELLEAYYSESTRDVLLSTIKELDELYDNELIQLLDDDALNVEVQNQFNTVFEILALNGLAEQDLILGNTTNFNAAHDEVQVLLKILKVDVALKWGLP